MQIARRPSPVRGSFPSARKALAAMAMALAHAAGRQSERLVGLPGQRLRRRHQDAQAPIPMSVSRMASRR